MRKKILYGVLVAITLVFFLWFFAPLQKPIEKNTLGHDAATTSPPSISGNNAKALPQSPPLRPQSRAATSTQTGSRQGQTPREATTSPPAESAPANSIRVTLTAGPSAYKATASPEATIYDVMASLTRTSSFTFQAKYFSGLGYLIETINEVRSQNGQYWKLYVNGKYADSGVSQYKLSDGDTVEWKYEKD